MDESCETSGIITMSGNCYNKNKYKKEINRLIIEIAYRFNVVF